MGIGKLFLEVSMEGEIPYCDAVVSFYEYHENDRKELKWKLRGRFDGFGCVKGVTMGGYVVIPISGLTTRMYTGEKVGEIQTNHPAQDRRRLRAIWQYLQDKQFEMVDIEEEEETIEETA